MVSALDLGSSGPHSWFKLQSGILCCILGKEHRLVSAWCATWLICRLHHLISYQTLPLNIHQSGESDTVRVKYQLPTNTSMTQTRTQTCTTWSGVLWTDHNLGYDKIQIHGSYPMLMRYEMHFYRLLLTTTKEDSNEMKMWPSQL